MSQINTANLLIPEDISDNWQNILNSIAESMSIPITFIINSNVENTSIFSSSVVTQEVHHTSSAKEIDRKISCRLPHNYHAHMLIRNVNKLMILPANNSSHLSIEHCRGLPVKWPDGRTFGTICISDDGHCSYQYGYNELITNFRNSIESQLTTLYQLEKLKKLNLELNYRVDLRNQDLVYVNNYLDQEKSKLKQAEDTINYQQKHDIGTGFLNHLALENESRRLIKCSENSGLLGAAIHITFTNGQQIQTHYGCNVWETLLTRFRQKVGDVDKCQIVTIRSSSLDLVLLVQTPRYLSTLDNLCQRLTKVCQSEFEIDDEQFHLHAYIGISTTDDTLCSKNLLHYASKASYSNKDVGNNFSYFSQVFTNEHQDHHKLEAYLLQAVRNDELLVYFQPKICMKSHHWIGAEALLRWRHPTLGDISSETLIHIAEQNGLIFQVGSFVLKNAIQKGSEWVKRNSEFKIAINISVIQLNSPNFVNHIKGLLTKYQLSPKNLELEITESGLVIDEAVMSHTMSCLHELGVTLSLDDFGTGYSTYDYLKKFPFDVLKVDKSFIKKIDENSEDQEIVKSIIDIAKKFNLQVTAEGVENKKHEKFITNEGCDFAQGYLYAKPMPYDEFESSLFNQ
ncbi:bifunctional diguanylate cyclase/phosphodiesterase [Vibrio hepatarius]|uniref:bifunctional diguanylate cyclase/phosphodiesterase n=1 Tax=Vibrio hepatarius TaxID=171383 RepID=UPI001C0A0AE8|nr:GGDEF domain-containing phosphodiesterase [Vibrio hepatarius]MBU2895188.1 EAL domain-containing protein [Vibrio hepatarius]